MKKGRKSGDSGGGHSSQGQDRRLSVGEKALLKRAFGDLEKYVQHQRKIRCAGWERALSTR